MNEIDNYWNEVLNHAQKENSDKIKDLQNKYKSKLKEATQPKLTKVYNESLIIELTAKVEVLQELINKL